MAENKDPRVVIFDHSGSFRVAAAERASLLGWRPVAFTDSPQETLEELIDEGADALITSLGSGLSRHCNLERVHVPAFALIEHAVEERIPMTIVSDHPNAGNLNSHAVLVSGYSTDQLAKHMSFWLPGLMEEQVPIPVVLQIV